MVHDVRISLPENACAVMGRWLVRKGDAVHEGQVLARYMLRGGQHAGKDGDLICPTAGSLSEILVKEGGSVSQDRVVCQIGNCAHEETYMGICSKCGQDVEEGVGTNDAGGSAAGGGGVQNGSAHGKREAEYHDYGMFGSVSHPAFRRSRQSARNQEMERLKTMMHQKKLALVLDLDHTLLHTTMPRSPFQHLILERISSSCDDVYSLSVNGSTYYTKLRPHVRTFLQEMSKYFELYVYTAGDRAYADTIAGILDRTGRWFNGRIISRDDYPDVPSDHKKLDKIFPIDEHWATAIILDDNAVTWDHPSTDRRNPRENLIHVVKFSYWPNDLGETHNPVTDPTQAGRGGGNASAPGISGESTQEDSGVNSYVESILGRDVMDAHLADLGRLLRGLHVSFFRMSPARTDQTGGEDIFAEGQDVRVLLREAYTSILAGVNVVFSGVFQNRTSVRQAGYWITAEGMGARCTETILSDTTHLVYVQRGDAGPTQKIQQAVGRGDVEIVSPKWLEACRGAWRRMEEETFRPENFESVRAAAEEASRAVKESAQRGHCGDSTPVVAEGGTVLSSKRKREDDNDDDKCIDGAGVMGTSLSGHVLIEEMFKMVSDVDSLLGASVEGAGREARPSGEDGAEGGGVGPQEGDVHTREGRGDTEESSDAESIDLADELELAVEGE